MKKIAITGGIGSGKSTVIELIKDQGFPVFSCDEIYKEIIVSKEYIQKIQEHFPTAVKNEKIDKQILSTLIFKDKTKRDMLNQIAHPLIMKRLFWKMDLSNDNLVFAEVPLLFEGNFENLFDAVIVVKRDLKSRINSVATRDNLTAIEVESRINAQFLYDSSEGQIRIKNSNAYVIDNNTSIQNLLVQLNNTINAIKIL